MRPSPPQHAATPPEGDAPWRYVIGIVGGLGPFAHLELERQLLVAAAARLARPPRDQDFPEWLMSSIPATPDRTQALLGTGPSPVPLLTQSVRRLYGSHQAKGADFAIIACNTAHAYLDEVRRHVRLPLLDMIGETVTAACARYGSQVTIGVMGTTGTVRAGLYARTAAALGHCVRTVSLLDVHDGARDGAWLQENLVMAPIYGPRQGSARAGGGIKSGLVDADPEQTRVVTERAAGPLRDAVRLLAGHGADVCVLACTEIPWRSVAHPSTVRPCSIRSR